LLLLLSGLILLYDANTDANDFGVATTNDSSGVNMEVS